MGRSKKRLCTPPEVGAGSPGRELTIGQGAESSSHVWLPEIVGRIAAELPSNEVACTLRLVDSASAAQFRDRIVVKLSEPSPHPAFSARWAAPGSCRSLALEQRRKLVCLTAAAGDVSNLAVAVEAAGVVLGAGPLKAAARAGKLEVCKWLCEPGRLTPNVNCRGDMLEAAAEGGHRKLCEWVLASSPGAWNEWAVRAALQRGHMELVDWLLSVRPEGCQPLRSVVFLQSAAEGCGLAAFKELCSRDAGLASLSQYVKNAFLPYVATRSTIDWRAKIDYLLAQGAELELPLLGIYEEAAKRLGDAAAERFAWLEEQGFDPVEGKAMEFAVQAGNTVAVRYLLGRGFREGYSPMSLQEAATQGKLELLRALHEAGCELRVYRIIQGACRGGQVEIMEWLLEAFPDQTLDLLAEEPPFLWAASSGNCRLMRWMVEHGAACRSRSWRGGRRASPGMRSCWSFFRSWARPCRRYAACAATAKARDVWAVVAGKGDLRTLRALKRLGLPWGSGDGAMFAQCVFDARERNGAPLAALQQLLAEGCPVSWPRALAAAQARRRANLNRNVPYAEEEAERLLAWVEEQAEAARAARAGGAASAGRRGRSGRGR
ncbi:hypothetical protein HYH03_007343 [Edaphochlamys debaryana]|uniref:Ankyrin repeat domain-containing protein n=1 Tax=Edaphochlamys debaryana TaxID=47281 RepID=A0A836C037_9CHLO|nr:hypothetical protein HYH03_007343 [Edaphochlamys debaryana]|eukprot:KAG2494577.1 hypothetical protein HYH03_007343 [Edaphochlamys debaryana]